MFDIIWLLIGTLVYVYLWCIAPLTEQPGPYKDRSVCRPIKVGAVLLAFIAIPAWPIVVVIAFFVTCIIVARSGFLNKELFNPCDIFKRK